MKKELQSVLGMLGVAVAGGGVGGAVGGKVSAPVEHKYEHYYNTDTITAMCQNCGTVNTLHKPKGVDGGWYRANNYYCHDHETNHKFSCSVCNAELVRKQAPALPPQRIDKETFDKAREALDKLEAGQE